MKGTKQMIRFLLLAVHATPFHTPYKDATTCADYNKDTNRLAVGTTDEYVAEVIGTWNTDKSDNLPSLVGHSIISWRAGKNGLYLTHTTNGRNWNTYLPDITDVQKVTADRLNPLVDMYTDISSRPGMTTKDIVDFVVSKSVNDFLAIEDPTPAQIIDILSALSRTMRALDETIVLNGYNVSSAQVWKREADNKLPHFLTKPIAQALQSSKPDTVRAFLQLWLRTAHHKPLADEIVPILIQKIHEVSSLDLSDSNQETRHYLLERSVFVRLLTSPATLATINNNNMPAFKSMVHLCINKYKHSCDDESIRNVLENQKFSESSIGAINQYIEEKSVQTVKAVFPALSTEVEALITKKMEEVPQFMALPENQALSTVLDGMVEEIIAEPFSLEFLNTMQQQGGPDQSKWKKLYETYTSPEVAGKIQQERKLYAEGIIHVIAEIKRRFDAARLKDKESLHILGIRAAAVKIWDDHKITIDLISPEAAAQLKEMAEYVQ